MRFASTLFAAFVALSATSLNAAPNDFACDLDYRFEAKWDDAPRRFEVTLTYDRMEAQEGTLIGPKSWGGVENFDRTITDIRAVTPDAVLKVVSSNVWTIATNAPNRRVAVRYNVINGIANIDDETPIAHRDFHRNTLGKSHFQLIGNGALVAPQNLPDYASRTTCITFAGMPADWTFASSFGTGQSGGVASYRAKGLSNLMRNAVFLGGDYRLLERKISGQPLIMAVRGKWSFADGKFADTTATVVQAHRTFWNDFDFPHYLIALAPNRAQGSSNGGTGLHNTFTMHASGDFNVPGAQFDFLVGHEHLHTWIPDRIGAMGEDESSRYWFSEGFTNYLTHRLLLQSGVWSLPQYASALNRMIATYLQSPVINVSNDRLGEEFFTNRAQIGELAYQRGELLALLWTNKLAQTQAPGKSLETHLQALKLSKNEAPARGAKQTEIFAVKRLRDALRRDLGDAVDADIDTFITRGETFAIDAQFLGPCFAAKVEDRALFEAGFDAQASFGNRKVSGVVSGSRAERAGLRNDMLIKGGSYHHGNSAQEVVVNVIEDGKDRKITFLPASDKTVRIPVFSAKPDAREQVDCKRWLGVSGQKP